MMSFHSAKETIESALNMLPTYAAEDLINGAGQAHKVLGDQTYTLRMTQASKLILTK